jgi:hypothetical protein
VRMKRSGSVQENIVPAHNLADAQSCSTTDGDAS